MREGEVPAAGPGRVVGVDVARCLALLGMMATHVLLETDADGTISASQWLFGGRASALFAVLAGVSLALVTGGRRPVRGLERAALSAGLAVRALLVAALGLALGDLESGIAVILSYYGVLFVLALPFLGLGARAALALGLLWIVVVPPLTMALRPLLPARGVASPHVGQLADPGGLLSELLFTGYYPAVPWVAYVLVGLGLGRLDLRSRRVQALVGASGGLVALAATWSSRLLTGLPAVGDALVDDRPGATSLGQVLDDIQLGMSGGTPVGGSWAWLAVVAPHSTTPLDLAQTAGSAALVLGACLLLVESLRGVARRVVAVVFGAGAMTLTLYSLHVVMRSPEVFPPERPDTYGWHVLVVLGVGAAYAAARRRGPLEQLVATMSGWAAAGVRGGPVQSGRT